MGPEVLPAKDVTEVLLDQLPELRQHCNITVVLTIVASLPGNNGTNKTENPSKDALQKAESFKKIANYAK